LLSLNLLTLAALACGCLLLLQGMQAELGAEAAGDISFEVSSPGAERTLILPQDLLRFKVRQEQLAQQALRPLSSRMPLQCALHVPVVRDATTALLTSGLGPPDKGALRPDGAISRTQAHTAHYSALTHARVAPPACVRACVDALQLKLCVPAATRLLSACLQELPMRVEYMSEVGVMQNVVLNFLELDEVNSKTTWELADVKANQNVKGRGLSKKQRMQKYDIPLESLERVRIYVDF
jgi:hypothetical protein